MLVMNLIVHLPISGLSSFVKVSVPGLAELTSSLVLRNEAGSSDSQLQIRLRALSLDLVLACQA